MRRPHFRTPLLQHLVAKNEEISYTYVKENFKLLKEYDEEYRGVNKCLFCYAPDPQKLKGEAWTHAQYCTACKSLSIVLVTDRMSGWWKDTIVCFGDN